MALAALAYGLTGMLNPTGQTVPLKPYLLALFAVPVLCAAGFTILYHLGWRTNPEPRSVEEALIREGRWHPGDITAVERAMLRREIAQRCLYGVDRNELRGRDVAPRLGDAQRGGELAGRTRRATEQVSAVESGSTRSFRTPSALMPRASVTTTGIS